MSELFSNDQIFIRKLTDIILANLSNENFGVKELAQESVMSLYRLSRKLHSINKKTTNQFIREVRLQKAMEMLQVGFYTASEISYKVGFGSPTYFNKSFRDFYGYPPGKIKKADPNSPELNILAQNSYPNRLNFFSRKTYILTSVLLFVLVSITVLFLSYNKFNVSERTEGLKSSETKISIAVMPFQNMTNDTIWNKWQDWIQQSLISSLANTGEIKVRQKESVKNFLVTRGMFEYVTLSPAIAGEISKKLEANIFIYGNLQQAGPRIRLDAQLIDTKTKEVLKSFEINAPNSEEIIFDITDSLRKKITDFLIVSKLIKENRGMQHLFTPTKSPQALRFFVYGNNAMDKNDFSTARNWYLKALVADSNFFYAALMIENTYSMESKPEQQRQWLIKNYKKSDQMPIAEQYYAKWAYACNFDPPNEQIKYLRQLQEIDDQVPSIPYLIGLTYNMMNQYDKAIPELEKSLEIGRKWGKSIMTDNWAYLELGLAYHKTGQHKKENRLYKESEKYDPDYLGVIFRQAVLSLAEKDSVEANRNIEKYVSICKVNSFSEAVITGNLARLYSEADMFDRAVEYFLKAISLEPENPDNMNALAWFFIENDRNINEGLELIDKALKLSPDKYSYLDTKGWGLYKQGRNEEALEFLEKSVELHKPLFSYKINLHIEEVKKAIAEKKIIRKI
jgi:tetratricopeptide (TPR) repeat protein/AraC-like DNA-binding protein